MIPAIAWGCLALGTVVRATDKPVRSSTDKRAAKQTPAGKNAAKLVPLNQAKTVLFDVKGKRLLVKSKVVLREGLLEMLCCRSQTKEHESILATDAEAKVIHAGLLRLGAKSGTPVQFLPKYKPATGQRIDVFLQWTDKKGKPHRARGQSWVRHAVGRFYGETLKQLPPEVKIPKESELRYDKKNRELSWYGHMTAKQRDALLKLSRDPKYQQAIRSFYKRSQPRPMTTHWLFAGSGFYVDEKTGERFYQAEGGDVICVANFPTAMLDVAVESSSSGAANLLFEADTERIPPLETEVTIELIPVFEKKGVKGSK